MIKSEPISQSSITNPKQFRVVHDGKWAISVEKSQKMQDQLYSTRIWDMRLKIALRLVFSIGFISLLAFQNWYVFGIVRQALVLNRLSDLQLILGVVVSGTLTETYFIAKVIVSWMFKDIDYHDVPKTEQSKKLPDILPKKDTIDV